MEQSKSNFFTLENIVKLSVLSVFFVGIITYLTDIKQDIALIKQASVYEVKDLQYQITELKDCCNGRKRENRIVFNDRAAILPHGIEIETER